MITGVSFVDCDPAAHAPQMLEIINVTIAQTTWIYDYAPRSLQAMERYVEQRREAGFPVECAVDAAGHLLGYGTFGTFRALPAYRYTVEHSVFVAPRFRRQGVGAQLLRRMIDLAVAGDYHTLVGVIDSSNRPSIALHERFNFALRATLREVGYKHGRWLDALVYQRVLETPESPSEPPSSDSAGSQPASSGS